MIHLVVKVMAVLSASGNPLCLCPTLATVLFLPHTSSLVFLPSAIVLGSDYSSGHPALTPPSSLRFTHLPLHSLTFSSRLPAPHLADWDFLIFGQSRGVSTTLLPGHPDSSLFGATSDPGWGLPPSGSPPRSLQPTTTGSCRLF